VEVSTHIAESLYRILTQISELNFICDTTAFHIHVTHETVTTNKAERSTSVSASLSDPDIDDEFVVDIYYDNKFGTLIFDTVAGRSRCIFEEGTLPNEDPQLRLVRAESAFIYPDETMIFHVEIANLGFVTSTFWLGQEESSEFDAYGPDGMSGIDENGHVILLTPGETKIKFIEIARPNALADTYEFPPMQLFFKSQCMADMLPDYGDYNILPLANAVDDNDKPILKWIAPCPAVHWAAELKRNRSFLFNILSSSEDGDDVLSVTIFNPLGSGGNNVTKLAYSRLEEIIFSYRQVGTSTWKKGLTRTPTGSIATMDYLLSHVKEDNYGFLTLDWLLKGKVEQGDYEIVVETSCGGSGPAEVQGFQETVITGTYDITRPEQYGKATPLRQDIIVGEEISVYFTEEMFCQTPLTFDMKVDIIGTNYSDALEDGTSLQKSDLFVICEGRRIGFQLDLSKDINVHAILGKEFEVEIGKIRPGSLSSLQDKNENPMDPLQGNIKFTKRFANLDLSSAATSFVINMENTTCSTESLEADSAKIRDEIVAIIGIDEGRVKVGDKSCQMESMIVAVVVIDPPLGRRTLMARSDINSFDSTSLFYILRDTLEGKEESQGRKLRTKMTNLYSVSSMRLLPGKNDFEKISSSLEDKHEEDKLTKWGFAQEVISRNYNLVSVEDDLYDQRLLTKSGVADENMELNLLENLRKKDEWLQQELKERDEEMRKKDEISTQELRKRDEEMRKKDEVSSQELRKRDEEMKKKDEVSSQELRKRDEEMKKKDEVSSQELRKRDEEMKKKDELLFQELRKRDEEMMKKDEMLEKEIMIINNLLK